jgi:exopolysaccharide biosynthesis polyprenyl glycosylphosphotransferase
MTRERSLEHTILLQDILLFGAALMLAGGTHAVIVKLLPGLKPQVATGEYAHLLLVFLPTWIVAAERLGIHRVGTLAGDRLEIVRRVILTQAWGVAAIGLILTFAQVSLNRSLIVVFLVQSTALLLIAKALQARWLARRRGQSRMLLIGEASAELTSAFERLRGRQVERWNGDDPAALDARFRAGAIDEVMLVGNFEQAQTVAYVEACAQAGVPVFLPVATTLPTLPTLHPSAPLPVPDIEVVGDRHYLVYQPGKLEARALAAKALVDRVLAAVGIVVLLPVMLVVALLVALFVGRPIVYVQRRGGLYGQPFTMLKFRSMRVGAEQEQAALRGLNEMDGPVFKMTDDPRVTRFGRVLRRTSLDELPQLFNVLAGQMSIVGPRPLPLDETRALAGRHRRRLSVRPGLTCLWQVSGRSDLTFDEWMALDLEYVERWSLGLDVAIMLRTIPAIVSRRGAR